MYSQQAMDQEEINDDRFKDWSTEMRKVNSSLPWLQPCKEDVEILSILSSSKWNKKNDNEHSEDYREEKDEMKPRNNRNENSDDHKESSTSYANYNDNTKNSTTVCKQKPATNSCKELAEYDEPHQQSRASLQKFTPKFFDRLSLAHGCKINNPVQPPLHFDSDENSGSNSDDSEITKLTNRLQRQGIDYNSMKSKAKEQLTSKASKAFIREEDLQNNINNRNAIGKSRSGYEDFSGFSDTNFSYEEDKFSSNRENSRIQYESDTKESNDFWNSYTEKDSKYLKCYNCKFPNGSNQNWCLKCFCIIRSDILDNNSNGSYCTTEIENKSEAPTGNSRTAKKVDHRNINDIQSEPLAPKWTTPNDEETFAHFPTCDLQRSIALNQNVEEFLKFDYSTNSSEETCTTQYENHETRAEWDIGDKTLRNSRAVDNNTYSEEKELELSAETGKEKATPLDEYGELPSSNTDSSFIPCLNIRDNLIFEKIKAKVFKHGNSTVDDKSPLVKSSQEKFHNSRSQCASSTSNDFSSISNANEGKKATCENKKTSFNSRTKHNVQINSPVRSKSTPHHSNSKPSTKGFQIFCLINKININITNTYDITL